MTRLKYFIISIAAFLSVSMIAPSCSKGDDPIDNEQNNADKPTNWDPNEMNLDWCGYWINSDYTGAMEIVQSKNRKFEVTYYVYLLSEAKSYTSNFMGENDFFGAIGPDGRGPLAVKIANSSKNYILLKNLPSETKELLSYKFNRVDEKTFYNYILNGSPYSDRGPVTGVYNGYDYVDLGLGVKWATCNVGAKTPTEPGDYFAWGETSPKSTYTESNYTLPSGYLHDGLKPEYDAATKNMGGKWIMPTNHDMNELIDKCIWEWDYKLHGYRITGYNGAVMFLPAAGSYITKDLCSYWTQAWISGQDGPWALRTGISHRDDIYQILIVPYTGMSVRGVFY